MESLSTLLPSGEEGVIDIPATGETPLELLERREMRDALEQAITQLPPSFRLPLILKDLLELSVEEVAEVLGLKEATVKTRVHRARLRVAREVTKRLPRASAPPPDHARRVCLDLLRVKMEALDRGASFPVAPEELCQRCRSLFDSLDLARNTCRRISLGEMPDSVRQAVLEEMGRARHEVNVRA
jgi:RNA polymerase sigma-70 factor (ECF subfamily)